MGVRLVMVTTLLLIAVYVEAVSEQLLPVNPLYFLIVGTYALTVLHGLAIRFVKRPVLLAYVQIIADLLIVTGLVWVSGEVHAGFVLLYPITVLSGSVLLFRTGGLVLAGLGTALYAGLLWGVRVGLLPLQGLAAARVLPPEALAYSTLLTGVACFTVALVGSYLAANLHSVGEQLEEAEVQVADLQELNEAIVNSIHSGLLTADAAGRALHVNPFGALILGRRAEDIRGRPIEEVFDSAALAAEALRVRGADSSLARIDLGYRKPGEAGLRQFGISVWPLHSAIAAALEGHLLAFQDLTDIKRLEDEVRMKERLAAVGEMAAQLAHEIRNPLGSISGSAQMLMRGAQSPEETQLLNIIRRESGRLSETLNRFLFQARPSPRLAGPVDIAPAIEQAVRLLRNSEEVGRSRVVEFEAERGSFLCLADLDQIVQVFWNLARNGLEAMSDGGTLSIRLCRKGSDLSLSFHDQGCGLSGVEESRLFEPFHTARSSGTGLGLAIVYRIIRQHAGDISIRSAVTGGTVVEVLLPLISSASPA
jgi:two-component system sensor histidine kinase PilS (NtrC family)